VTATGLSRDRDRPVAMKKTGSSQGRSVSHKRQRKRIAGKAKGTGQPHHLSYSGGPVASFKRRGKYQQTARSCGREALRRKVLRWQERIPGGKYFGVSGRFKEPRKGRRENPLLLKAPPVISRKGLIPGSSSLEREAPVQILGLGSNPCIHVLL